MNVRGRTCIVTGSAQGIGKAIALKLLENGAKVCISDVNETASKATLEEFKSSFGKDMVHLVTCDVTNKEQFLKLFDEAEQFFHVKCIDILVNNAGVNEKFGWRKCMDVNIMGVMTGGEIAMDRMSNSPSKGTIINVASTAALVTGVREMIGYSVSKHGVVAYTRGTAADFTEHGVIMKAICPLWVDTELVSTGIDSGSEELASKIKNSIKRTGGLLSPADIAESFFKLLTECENGTVLYSAKDTPCIIIPNVENILLMLLTIMAKIVGKLQSKTILRVGDQKLFMVFLTILILLAAAIMF